MPPLSSFELTGRVTVVTGAGRGIGRQIALDVARSGAKVAVGSRSVPELESLTEEIQALGGELFYHFLDVTAVESIQEFMAKTVAHYGRIDALVNNAGFNKQLPILDYDEALYDQILDANLKSVFFCSQTVAKRTGLAAGAEVLLS